ncbi:MAG: hypothetical protein MJ032_00975, partial [Acidaminococcaceae bacterium]|nr:hypothetical protein [Acidaminococcaceae bacterium]
MKKSLMTAVGAAVLLTGMTAFANEYPVTHPFYMPDKGGCYFDVGYSNTQSKFKTEDAKFAFGDNKLKANTYSVDGIYAVSDKCYVNAGYSGTKTELNASSSELALGLSSLLGVNTSLFNFDNKDKNWYVGVTDKFIDNDSMLV